MTLARTLPRPRSVPRAPASPGLAPALPIGSLATTRLPQPPILPALPIQRAPRLNAIILHFGLAGLVLSAASSAPILRNRLVPARPREIGIALPLFSYLFNFPNGDRPGEHHQNAPKIRSQYFLTGDVSDMQRAYRPRSSSIMSPLCRPARGHVLSRTWWRSINSDCSRQLTLRSCHSHPPCCCASPLSTPADQIRPG